MAMAGMIGSTEQQPGFAWVVQVLISGFSQDAPVAGAPALAK